MFTIEIKPYELFDESTQSFITGNGRTLQLEHSLIAISKWESKWHTPFLDSREKSPKEIEDYVKCMTITKNVPDEVYSFITRQQYQELNNYLADPMTATTITDRTAKKGSSELMTSELIYYYMISHNIPMDCDRWHINRLLTLIRVCNVKSQPAKKRPQKDVMRENAALNAARKKQYNTKG